MNQNMSWIKILAFNIFLTFGMLEIGLYLLEERQYSQEKDNGYSNVFRSMPSKSYLFDHHPNIEYLLSSNGLQYTVITNESGLRESMDYDDLEESVIFLGDSIIEGAAVENDETIDHYFESSTGIVSLNFGVSSYNTVQELEYLRDRYKKNYNTKLVILGFCLNDLLQNHFVRSFDSKTSNWRVDRYLSQDNQNINSSSQESTSLNIKSILKKSRTIKTAYNFFMLSFLQNEYFLPNNEELQYTEQAITHLQRYVNSLGADLFIVIYPYQHQLRSKSLSKLPPQDLLLPILEKLEINSLNLLHPLRNLFLKDLDLDIYHDNVHPNAKGHEIISQMLINDLKKKSLITRKLGIHSGQYEITVH
jgi:lysophospholipase L1-like esterase